MGDLVRDVRGPAVKRYIAKPDTWFDARTEVTLLVDCAEGGGIFLGLRNGQADEEFCAWEEFEEVEL